METNLRCYCLQRSQIILNSKLPSSRHIFLPLLYEVAKIQYSSLLLTFPTRLVPILLGSLKSGWTAETLGTFMKMIE